MKIHSRKYFTIEDILELVGNRLSGLKKNAILSAYEFADKALDEVYENDKRVFFHSTRVCYTLINEYKIFNPDLIIASLLSDIHKSQENISETILDINFGPYVTLLVGLMSNQDDNGLIEFEILMPHFKNTDVSFDDFLIIWLLKHLDKFRCLDYVISTEIIEYIFDISELINTIPEFSSNQIHLEIINNIKNERNKLLC